MVSSDNRCQTQIQTWNVSQTWRELRERFGKIVCIAVVLD